MKTTANNTKQPLTTTAYEQIHRKIITLEYKPGQILEEKQLMEDLGLGRTPIREALLRLAGERMIEYPINRGIIVPPISLQGTKALFAAMSILEFGVASLAVYNNVDSLLPYMFSANERIKASIEGDDMLGLVDANHDFHTCFARCSQNDYLFRAVCDVRNHAKKLSYLSYATEIERNRSRHIHYESVIQEHEEMITYMKEKNETELKKIVSQHITTFQQRIIRYLIGDHI